MNPRDMSSLGDPWYKEPAAPADPWESITARRAAETAPAPDPWAAIEARRAADVLPAPRSGLALKPVHFAIGGLLLLAFFALKGRSHA